MDNMSSITTFYLKQPQDLSYRQVYFICIFFIYILILFINTFLSLVIVLEKALHEPMFIFLCNLCLNALFGSAGFYPKFLSDLLSGSYVISYYMCAVQAFVIYSAILCEYSTLSVMAFDRYVAICKPLDYHSILTKYACLKLILFSWTVPVISMLIGLLISSRLPFCGSNIDKLYCDNWAIVKLSCHSSVPSNIYGFFVIVLFSCFAALILVSYVRLIAACKASLENRRKFWQTCVPHMFSLTNFCIASLFNTLYSRFGSDNVPESIRTFFALVVIILPPLLNPLIYGLKLKQVRKRVVQMFKKVKVTAFNKERKNKVKT